MHIIFRFLGWINIKLYIVETDPFKNAYFNWADARLDELENFSKPAVTL